MLHGLFARNSKFFTTIFSAVCENPTAIGSCHSFTKSVFILSFSAGRLKCTFHRVSRLTVKIKKGCKDAEDFWDLQPKASFFISFRI
jgi:hypothetical protein